MKNPSDSAIRKLGYWIAVLLTRTSPPRPRTWLSRPRSWLSRPRTWRLRPRNWLSRLQGQGLTTLLDWIRKLILSQKTIIIQFTHLCNNLRQLEIWIYSSMNNLDSITQQVQDPQKFVILWCSIFAQRCIISECVQSEQEWENLQKPQEQCKNLALVAQKILRLYDGPRQWINLVHFPWNAGWKLTLFSPLSIVQNLL